MQITRQGSWELVDGVEHAAGGITGEGVGFDWTTDMAAPGVTDVCIGDIASCLSPAVVATVNRLIDAVKPRVVRLFCGAAPRSAAEASLMSAALGLIAPQSPVVLYVESQHLETFRLQAERAAPWSACQTDAEVDAAVAAWLA